MNPFRKRSDTFEAVGFAIIALVSLALALMTGWWLFIGLTGVATVRSVLFVRSMRAGRRRVDSPSATRSTSGR